MVGRGLEEATLRSAQLVPSCMTFGGNDGDPKIVTKRERQRKENRGTEAFRNIRSQDL